MRRRTLILGIACVVLNGFAGWSAFRGPDWLTTALTLLLILALLGLVANLLLYNGDWLFRAVALFIVGTYLLFNAIQLWQFFTRAD